jgi:hypothetical protein
MATTWPIARNSNGSRHRGPRPRLCRRPRSSRPSDQGQSGLQGRSAPHLHHNGVPLGATWCRSVQHAKPAMTGPYPEKRWSKHLSKRRYTDFPQVRVKRRSSPQRRWSQRYPEEGFGPCTTRAPRAIGVSSQSPRPPLSVDILQDELFTGLRLQPFSESSLQYLDAHLGVRIEVRFSFDLHPFERFVRLGVDQGDVQRLGSILRNAERSHKDSILAAALKGLAAINKAFGLPSRSTSSATSATAVARPSTQIVEVKVRRRVW